MKIGITERGDAGLDLSWEEKIHNMDMSILITKNITPNFKKAVLRWMSLDKIIVHCGCTGWGGSWLEPNVPPYFDQLYELNDMIANGFPKEQCVLRIDPIVPNDEGIYRLNLVLEKARALGLLPGIRVRVSILDEYRHVKTRIRAIGRMEPFYENARKYPTPQETALVRQTLESYGDITFETCAEPYLSGKNIEHTGCISQKDLDVFGLQSDTSYVNPQNRTGCLCLAGKRELLCNKKRCPHQCLYCYWVD